MANSSSAGPATQKRPGRVRNPLLVLLLSAGVFVLADNLVFRTAFYARFIPLVTTSGRLAHFVLAEENRAPSGKDEVLTTGSSKMQFALWDKVAEQADPQGRFRMIDGAIHGASEKWTYYILKRIDPTHRRYAAIVISDSEYKVYPWAEDQENDFSCAQALAPFIAPRDWPDFAASFTDPAVRENVVYQGLFSSHGVGMDFLLSSGRITERILRGGVTKLLTDEGPAENVAALSTAPDQESLVRVVSYPAHFDIFQREDADSDFRNPDLRDAIRYTEREARFHQRWLTKIIELYKDSPTRLIFVQMPRWPVQLPKIAPLPTAPDIRGLLPKQRNVVFLDENEFTFLERPKYFWDLQHLNRTGRRIFSERLGMRIREIVGNTQPQLRLSSASARPVGTSLPNGN
jgi:hypothetical protein